MQNIATPLPPDTPTSTDESDLDTLLQQIGTRLPHAMPFASGGVLFNDPTTRLLYPRLYLSSTRSARSPRLFQWTEGHFKTIAEKREPLLINDLDQSNYLRCDPAACSAIVAPIIQGKALLGVIFAEASQLQAYTNLHLILLTTWADQIALVATMSERYTHLNHRYNRLSAYNDQMLLRNEISRLITDDLLSESLWPRLADYVARFSHANECAITLWDESHEQVQLLGRYSAAALQAVPEGAPLAELSFDWDMLTRKMALNPGPLLLRQITADDSGQPPLLSEKVQALLGMPLIARQKYMGAVLLVNTETVQPFSVLDVTQLTTVLDKIGLTIDNNVLFRGLQAQLSEASALLEVGRIATSTPDIDPMLWQVIEFVCRSLGAEVGLLLLHDSASKTLQVRVNQTARLDLRNMLDQLSIASADAISMTARTFRSGQGYFMNTISTSDHARAYALYHKLGLRNVLEVPIRILDRSIGIVIIGNKDTDFSRADLNFLSAVCNYLSSALYNADLLDQTRRQLTAADTMRSIANITGSGREVDEILNEVTEKVARLVDAPGAVVYLFDRNADWLFANDKSCYGIAVKLDLPVVYVEDRNPIAETYRRREIQWQPRLNSGDTNGLESTSVVTCPLHIHQRTLGVLVILGLDLDTLYDDNYQIESMRAAAAQIAVSIENTQLFAAERQRANLMALIIEIGQTLASQLDIRGLTRSVVKSVHELLNYEAVFLYTLDEESASQITLASAATSHIEMRLPDDSKFALGSGVVGRAFVTGNVELLINRPGNTDVYWPSSKYRVFSELVFPLRNRDKVIGVLEIVSTRPIGFHEMERTALGTLASQISTAMENARLWDEARNRLVEEQIVSQIGNVLVSILDYKQLGEAIVQHMARAMDTPSCLLIRYVADTDEAIIEAEYRPPDLAIRLPQRHTLSPETVEGQIIRKAISTRRLARYPDTEGFDLSGTSAAITINGRLPLSSAIALPLIARDRTIGCMLWVETRADRRILGSDIRLAQTLTMQAAIAVENARLFAELEERAFELAKANSLKSDFLARVSHELRTPLNSIIGYSDMLLNRLYGPLTEKQADRIERVRRNGLNLLRLIDDLLDISKIDSGKLDLQIEALLMADNVRNVVETLEGQVAARGLTLRVDLPPDLPLVLADAVRLRQVFTNLISNALKFTIQGSVTVSAETFIAQERPMVLIRIIDTGIGIAPEDQKIVFDEFRQVVSEASYKYAGTGLGLSIVRRFVELMGGRVWVESTLGSGSTFFFTLYAAPDYR